MLSHSYLILNLTLSDLGTYGEGEGKEKTWVCAMQKV